MELTVKNLLLSYETLADQSVKLNRSYLSLLKVYEELILAPGLLAELDKAGCSPLKVIESLRLEKDTIKEKFTQLIQLINDAQKYFVTNPEAKELTEIARDCLAMQQFINKIDLNQLQEMFEKVTL